MSDPLVPYFQEFLKRISLTTNQRRELIKNHSTLRERLQQDCELAPHIKEIFLQGSYKRDTIVRHKAGKYSDVDIVVVMNLDKNKCSPDEVLQIFKPFLRHYYKGWCRRQTHSWGIKLSNVHMDVIPAVTSPMLYTNISWAIRHRVGKADLYIFLIEEKINGSRPIHYKSSDGQKRKMRDAMAIIQML